MGYISPQKGTVTPQGVTPIYDFSRLEDDGNPTGAATVTQQSGQVQQTKPEGKPAGTTAGGTSSTTTTTTTVSGQPYSQFSGNNYADLENFIRGQMDATELEDEEKRKKREKREKQTAFLARLADGLSTFHTAYSHARGVKPMDLPNMSVNAQKRFDKAKADREKEQDRWINYATQLGKIKDANRDFSFKVEQAQHQQNNWERKFGADREDRAEDVNYRNQRAAKSDEQWDKKFQEDQRQFDVTSKEHERHNRAAEGLQGASIAEQRRHNKASEGLESRRIAQSQDGKYVEFYSGSGMIRIPNTRLNSHNISYIYGKTPMNGRPQGEPTGSLGQRKAVTTEQMMEWIGTNIDDPNVQDALRAIGGVGGNNNTPPSRQATNDNTPPSRR